MPESSSPNVFFDNFDSFGEQNLYRELVQESIEIYGISTYYVSRRLTNYDKVMGEDDQSKYDRAFPMPFYLENVDGFTGDSNFISKLGLEVRDQITMSCAQHVFEATVGRYLNQSRPLEGSLIYFPLNDKCFQVRYTDRFEMFFPLGVTPTWKMTCELFEYSSETFDTGIREIDRIGIRESNANVVSRSDNLELGEGTTDFAGANSFVVFTESNPYSVQDEN